MDFVYKAIGIIYQGWIFTLPGVVIFVLAVCWPPTRGEEFSSKRRFALLALAVFPIAINLFGAAYWYQDSDNAAPIWPMTTLWFLLLGHVFVAIYLVVNMENLRPRTAVAAFSSAWVSLWVFFVSGMAVTNDWL